MVKTGIRSRPKRKISPEARLLMKSVLRQAGGCERRAARMLGLKVPSQFGRMLRGEMNETAEMHAAVLRARARARRAFGFQKLAVPPVNLMDLEKVRKVLDDIRWALDVAIATVGGAK